MHSTYTFRLSIKYTFMMPSAISPVIPAAAKFDRMASEVHNLDPEGDVTLIMTRYLECEIISELVEEVDSAVSKQKVSSDAADAEVLNGANDNDLITCEQEVLIRASSRHLILASSVFRAMLQRKFSECNALQKNGSVEIRLPADDPDAFLILLNIIHGYMRRVPTEVDIDTYTQIAVLTDKYDVHEAVEIFTNSWFEKLKDAIPKTYTEDIPGWICICWIFNRPQEFKHVTRLALRQGKQNLPLGDLPIPAFVADTIDSQRIDSISRIVSILHVQLADYLEKEHCSFECDSLMLGALTKRLRALHLFPNRPDPPFTGLCFEQFAYRFGHGLYFPAAQRTSTYYYEHAKCAIPSIEQTLTTCNDQLAGLELNDFKP
ncbi:BTB domain-containing protein [Histoplasma ohiense]|nr:BTB domain-containing protein [Histoplasma ohiense (nom. inval.)]